MPMDKVILIIGVVVILWGIWVLVRPGIVKAIIRRLKGPLVYLPACLRVVLGVVFLVSVRDCRIRWVITTLGILMFAAGIVMFMVKPARLQAFFERWADRPLLMIRILGVVAAAFGALTVWAA